MITNDTIGNTDSYMLTVSLTWPEFAAIYNGITIN